MKKLIIFTSTLILSLVLGSSANATFISSSADASLTGANVIDFEGEAFGTFSSITIDDVTFTAADDRHLRIDSSYGYNSTGRYLDNGSYGSHGFGTMDMEFAGGTDAFGFNWSMAESWADWTLTAYDAAHTIIESWSLPSTGSSSAGEFFGISASGIATASLSWTGNYDWISIDNFSYTTEAASVPEPSIIALFGAGLVGLGFARRRKSRQA